MLAFIWELCVRAWTSSVASMGTTTLAIGGGLIYPLADLISELRQRGLAAMNQHWKNRLKISVFIAVVWWSILFSYHLFYRVPQHIRAQALNVVVPGVAAPKVPGIAFERRAIEYRAAFAKCTLPKDQSACELTCAISNPNSVAIDGTTLGFTSYLPTLTEA